MGYQPGDEIAGKYRLIEAVGGGAMGQVFKAEHILMHKTVAIKILHQSVSGNTEIIQRFKREAQSAAAIDHSNICNVMDFDTTESGDFYLVMEFLEGDTLQKRIRSHGALHPAKAVFIMQQLLSVLQSAHDHGIVHRDVKPENIALIYKDGTNDFVKLLDFGIAHQDEIFTTQNEGDNLKTQMGFLYGTPEYIAPEQAEGTNIDYRVDLYACGIILYEMLTGTVPFKHDSIINLLHMQACDPPPHLNVNAIEHGAEFDAIIQKLLSKRREDRYQSALSVSEALSAITISADPDMLAAGSTVVRLQVLQQNNAPEISGDALQKRRVVIITIAIAAIIVLVVVLLAALQYDSKKTPETSTPAGLGVMSTQPKEVAVVQPFIYKSNNSDFSISEDNTLIKDQNFVKAMEAYYQQDYQTCYDNIVAVEDLYKTHPNYLRLRIQAAYNLANSISKGSSPVFQNAVVDIVDTYTALTQIVPDAIRNEAVSTAIHFTFMDMKGRVDYENVLVHITSKPTPNQASALVWALVYTQYDANDNRKKRIIKAYDNVPHDNVPEWQNLAVEAWRLDKDNCKARSELIQKIFLSDAPRQDIYYAILAPLHKNLRLNYKESKRYQCKMNWKSIDCNHCIKDWIVSGYGDWTKRIEDGTIEKAPIPFTVDEPQTEAKVSASSSEVTQDQNTEAPEPAATKPAKPTKPAKSSKKKFGKRG